MFMKILSKKNGLRLSCMLLGVSAFNINASQSDSQIEQGKPKCPDIPLLQNASLEQIALSMVQEKDRAFLSKQYCFVLFGPNLHHLEDEFFAVYNDEQNSVAFRNYSRTLHKLTDLETRFIFIHFLLRELSQKMTVTGKNDGSEHAHILVRTKASSTKKQFWFRWDISKGLPYEEFMKRLSIVQQGNPKPNDYPSIMKLVEKVLDGNHLLGNEELNNLIALL